MLTSVLVMLTVFYAGAVIATGRSWLDVRRGAVGFSGLRDLTGISDRAVLRRLFGLTRPDGKYNVSVGDVLRHRRLSGTILADLPVHALFLAALLWASLQAMSPAALAIAFAAGMHALTLAAAALSIVARSRLALLD
jgi:hypothetical protein